MAVAVDVAQLQAVAVDHVAVEQHSGFPIRPPERIVPALEQAHGAAPVAGRDDHLRILRVLETAGEDQAAVGPGRNGCSS